MIPQCDLWLVKKICIKQDSVCPTGTIGEAQSSRRLQRNHFLCQFMLLSQVHFTIDCLQRLTAKIPGGCLDILFCEDC